MKIAIAFDHAGIEFKPLVLETIKKLGHEHVDYGTHDAASCDYSDYAFAAAQSVACGETDRALLVCGTGVGMSIAANKVRGVRCALCHDTYTARMTREHNDANALALGSRVIGPEIARDIIKAFLATDFSLAERHIHRIEKITRYENGR